MRFWGAPDTQGPPGPPGPPDLNALQKTQNLADVIDPAESLANIGGMDENLSGANAPAARMSLDVYSTSEIDAFVSGLDSDIIAAANDALRKDQNLGDLPDKGISRTNLDVYSTSEIDGFVSTLDAAIFNANDSALQKAAMFADVPNKEDAMLILGAVSYTVFDDYVTSAESNFLMKNDNLDSVTNPSLALSNIGGMNSSLTGVNASAARTNMDVPQTSTVLLKSDNLSGISSPSTALSNIGGMNSSLTGVSASSARTNMDVPQTSTVCLKSDNLSGLANNFTSRINIGAQERLPHPNVASGYTMLTGRPFPMFAGTTLTLIKDRWIYMPFSLEATTSYGILSIQTSTAASGGTAAAIFAIYNLDSSTRKPSTLSASLASYGSIDLTAAPGFLTLSTAGLSISAGQYCIGFAWTGTAAVSPVLTALSGCYPSCAGSSASVNMSGFFQLSAGGTPPSPASPSTGSTQGIAIWARQ